MITDNGKSIAVIHPTEKAKQQQEQIAPLTHTQTKDCDRSLVETLTTGNFAIRVHKQPRKALFTPHNSGCPIPEEELDDWRLTIINRQGQEQEQLQENPTQLSKQELQRRLEDQVQKKDNTYTQSNIKDHTNKAELTTTTANGHTTNKIKDSTTSTAKDMET